MINVLKFVIKAWDEVGSNTIRNCFEKVDIIEKVQNDRNLVIIAKKKLNGFLKTKK
jgi:hypothetical protein